jgi:hypothetical protein
MSQNPPFDIAAAHKYFAAHCFNAVWDLIDKPERTLEDDRMMVALSQASIYHWQNRPDCEPRRLSVGYWQRPEFKRYLGTPQRLKIMRKSVSDTAWGKIRSCLVMRMKPWPGQKRLPVIPVGPRSS